MGVDEIGKPKGYLRHSVRLLETRLANMSTTPTSCRHSFGDLYRPLLYFVRDGIGTTRSHAQWLT